MEKLTNEKQNTVYGKCSCYYLYYFLITYFGSSTLNAGGAEALGGAIATALVTPHMIMFLIGAIFGRVGFIAKKSRAALVTAILYSVGTLFFSYVCHVRYTDFGVRLCRIQQAKKA